MFRRQTISFIASAVIGAGVGAAALAFRYATAILFQYGIGLASYLPLWLFAIAALLITGGGALIAGILMNNFALDAAGSGIPQVKKAYQARIFRFSWNLLWVKFIGGITAIGTGSSLGREGPTVHIGAALASKIAHAFKEPAEAKANALCAGAAAGLAAAFNSPLAGVTLVLEEIADSKNMDKYSGRCLFASAIAVSITYLMISDVATFQIEGNIPMRWRVFWLAPLVALFAGLIGVFFQWATLKLRKAFLSSDIAVWIRPALGAATSVVFCLIAFAMTSRLGAFGLGDEDIQALLNNQIVWGAAGWLLGCKLLATIFCYGSGGCGGIFAPLIFFGAMAGAVIYGLSAEMFQLHPQDQTLLCLIGMTASLAAVVRAPLTSILIVFEMTRQMDILPALMVASVIASVINTLFFPQNFYLATLVQDRSLQS